jgi:hypothetical protein
MMIVTRQGLLTGYSGQVIKRRQGKAGSDQRQFVGG